MNKIVYFSLFTLIALLSKGCTSIDLVTSTPPYEKIVVVENLKVGSNLGAGTVPKGEYTPVYEDRKHFYYLAPSKVKRKYPGLLASGLSEGGIMLKKDKPDEEMKWWFTVGAGDAKGALASVSSDHQENKIKFIPFKTEDSNSTTP